MNIEEVMKRIRLLRSTRPGENIEVEFRFGKFNGSFFDTNVGEVAFRKFMKVCSSSSDGKRSSTRWKMSTTRTPNVRMSVDCEEQRSLVRKSR